MKKRFLIPITFAALAAALAFPVTAQESQSSTVNATVSATFLAVSVTPNSVDYGFQDPNTDEITPTPAFFTIDNVGSELVDISIRGDDSDDWTLGSTAADEVYVHYYTAGGDGTSGFTPLTTSDAAVFPDYAPNDPAEDFHLQLDMPTSTQSTALQTLPVIITASAPAP